MNFYNVDAPELSAWSDLDETTLPSGVRNHKLFRLHGPRPEMAARQAWQERLSRIGDLMYTGEDGSTGQRDGSAWVDVRYDPGLARSFRHSKTAQPLHNDGAYSVEREELVCFIGYQSAASGGETLFVDCDALAAEIRTEEPALFEQLCSHPLVFQKSSNESVVMPVLQRGESAWTVNWNYYRVDAAPGSPEAVLRMVFQAYLQEQVIRSDICLPLRLMPGDVVLFHDALVMHGRHAFEAEQRSDRLLWKCSLTNLQV
jgi:alpha-ketoglutarate-dependent taurine dioxygenase